MVRSDANHNRFLATEARLAKTISNVNAGPPDFPREKAVEWQSVDEMFEIVIP